MLRLLQPLTPVFGEKKMSVVITLFRTVSRRSACGFLQARAKCFVLQRIRVHYISLQFNIKVQCYQNISQVLLMSAFILWPPCTCSFGIREKIRCGLRFFGVFLCGFAVFGPSCASLSLQSVWIIIIYGLLTVITGA